MGARGPALLPGRPLGAVVTRGRLRELWAGPVGYCLRVYLCFRAGLLALGLLVSGVLPHNGDVGVPGWPAPPPICRPCRSTSTIRRA